MNGVTYEFFGADGGAAQLLEVIEETFFIAPSALGGGSLAIPRFLTIARGLQ